VSWPTLSRALDAGVRRWRGAALDAPQSCLGQPWVVVQGNLRRLPYLQQLQQWSVPQHRVRQHSNAMGRLAARAHRHPRIGVWGLDMTIGAGSRGALG
jgi:hypothetical protein